MPRLDDSVPKANNPPVVFAPAFNLPYIQGSHHEKNLSAVVTAVACVLSVGAFAAPGEYWEVSTKMEMEGMPFAMPATTQKVCIPKDGEKDPGKTSGDKDCKMTDVKTVGNKTTWKARCTKDGEVMTGIGEQTTTSGAYQGKVKLSGKSEGQDMNMTMAYSGKRVGGSCDTGDAEKKIEAMVCDTSNYRSTADWISAADTYLKKGYSLHRAAAQAVVRESAQRCPKGCTSL